VTGGCKEIYYDSSGLILDMEGTCKLSDELGSRVCPGELFQASTGVFPAPRTTGSMRQFNGQVCIPVFPHAKEVLVYSTVAGSIRYLIP
jgi:hypothetical protein